MNSKILTISNNILTIETCLLTGTLSIPDLILYIQYDIPLEDSSEFYKKFCKSKHFKEQTIAIGNNEKIQASQKLLIKIINYIYCIEKDGNKSSIVYKETIDFCKNAINELEQHLITITKISNNIDYER